MTGFYPDAFERGKFPEMLQIPPQKVCVEIKLLVTIDQLLTQLSFIGD